MHAGDRDLGDHVDHVDRQPVDDQVEAEPTFAAAADRVGERPEIKAPAPIATTRQDGADRTGQPAGRAQLERQLGPRDPGRDDDQVGELVVELLRTDANDARRRMHGGFALVHDRPQEPGDGDAEVQRRASLGAGGTADRRQRLGKLAPGPLAGLGVIDDHRRTDRDGRWRRAGPDEVPSGV